jgi:dephospho-CoA kinase
MARTSKKIGLTGGIASGKSFVLECFAIAGLSTFSSDVAARQLLGSDLAVQREIALAFPEAVIEGVVDRNMLAEIVFKYEDRLEELESIMHPRIASMREQCIEAAAHHMVCETPLLFEKRLAAIFDVVISVIAGEELQKQRAMARNSVTAERFYAILCKQVSDSYRAQHSDFVIRTDCSKESTQQQIQVILGAINER